MEKLDRSFKGVWIPKEIWLNKDLTIQEKVFLAEIDSLDNDDGCYASNAYFADFFGLSKNRASEVINSLRKKGYIIVNYIKGDDGKSIQKRVIKLVNPIRKVEQGIRKIEGGIRKIEGGIRKIEGGYSENWEDNNTLYNNTNNIIDISKDISSERPKKFEVLFDELVDYYHKTCTDLPRIRILTDKRKRHIKARIKDYGLEAIYEVFDKTAASDFLSGRKTDWRASFDWLLLPTNFVKVLEDQYKNDDKPRQPKARYEVENPDWLQEHEQYRKSKMDDTVVVDPNQLKNLLESFKED